MAVTAQFLKNIMAEARPIIERQMNDAKIIAGFRDVVANAGGDWGALKALIKAHVEDENDETGEGKRVRKIRDKADSTSAYADMLGLANMNEKNFSDEHFDAETGEITEHEQPETASQSGLTNEVHTDARGPFNAGTLEQFTSAPAESVSDAISRIHSPSADPLPAEKPETVPQTPAVSGTNPRQINPNCRRAARGEQCALSHSQASCSKCQQIVDEAKKQVSA